MDNREIKKECYNDMLGDSIRAVESVLNQLQKLKNREGVIAEHVLQKARYRAYYDLELALATMSILLRKMTENMFITMDSEIRKDVNSIIHSNKFEYQNKTSLYVYSKKGREEVSVTSLLDFAKSIVSQ